MPKKIKIEQRSNYLYTEVTDVFDLGRAKKFYEEINQICIDRGFKKVIVDIRKMEGKVPILDKYELGRYKTERLHEVCIRIAYLCTEEQVLPDKFFENVSRNRGDYVLVTTDEDEAYQWLGIPE